jgi:hypothetical protein
MQRRSGSMRILRVQLTRKRAAGQGIYIVQESVRDTDDAEALTATVLLRLVIRNQSGLVLDRPKGETINNE